MTGGKEGRTSARVRTGTGRGRIAPTDSAQLHRDITAAYVSLKHNVTLLRGHAQRTKDNALLVCCADVLSAVDGKLSESLRLTLAYLGENHPHMRVAGYNESRKTA